MITTFALFATLVLARASTAILRIAVGVPTLWKLRNDNSEEGLIIRNSIAISSIGIAARAAVGIGGDFANIKS